MERRQEFMSEEVFDRILYQYVVPYKEVNRFCTPTFIPHKDSETLIGKNLPSQLLKLSTATPDMNIDIYSNGVLLPTWSKRGQDFIDFLATLPNHVRFLMSYHPRNHDGSVNDYGPTVAYLKGVLRSPPRNVEFITVSHRSHWVTPDMQQWWANTWTGFPITVHCNASLNPWTGLIEEEGTVQFNGCPYADFGHWFFGVTGNIIACCLDLEEEIVLGNVMHSDPGKMFARTEAFYAEQRRTLEEKRRVANPVCANCFGQKREDADLLQLGTKT